MKIYRISKKLGMLGGTPRLGKHSLLVLEAGGQSHSAFFQSLGAELASAFIFSH